MLKSFLNVVPLPPHKMLLSSYEVDEDTYMYQTNLNGVHQEVG